MGVKTFVFLGIFIACIGVLVFIFIRYAIDPPEEKNDTQSNDS
jgi:hypothetical protein